MSRHVELHIIFFFIWVPGLACQYNHSSEGDGRGVVVESSATSAELAAREQLAASGKHLVAATKNPMKATSDDLALAMDVPNSMLASATLIGPEDAVASLPNLGDLLPRKGDSLVVLSTGYVESPPSHEPGTDFAPGAMSETR